MVSEGDSKGRILVEHLMIGSVNVGTTSSRSVEVDEKRDI